MKKLLTTLILAAGLASCHEGKKTPEVVTPPRDTTVQVCDFGIEPTQFNITDRELPPESVAGKGGKKPKVVNPPPPPPGPKAPGVVLLDFDGHRVTGTSWNYAGDIVCIEAGLTVEEQQKIIDTATARYRGLNVRFTTDEAVYQAAAPTRRMRCIVTKTYDWFGQAGGVAFIGSFTWGDNTPCFIFSLLLNFNLKLIQEAVAHEVGHTLGCYHQAAYDANCVKVSEYDFGANGWAPIMGVGYYQPVVGWKNGPTPYGCNQLQNDTLVIKSTLQQ